MCVCVCVCVCVCDVLCLEQRMYVLSMYVSSYMVRCYSLQVEC